MDERILAFATPGEKSPIIMPGIATPDTRPATPGIRLEPAGHAVCARYRRHRWIAIDSI
ncbi:hypothetical protein NK553_26645 [Pseudomonas sp. ZM23]|uniref:Uncharacterized protein n=1 Tax=Pseudomonas triclosanedens TaxID=2961893 RepID=A0ABY6ZQ15_9PSED|nr:hypothetical protein [Pseudomonas triclosanedens]MCP8467537.1 hypothetical protein [Pseudomonas triclosanedens]MCP8471714.1 hypothetical protein [Pseudomonas triclosanedens]MCP8478933.1 hypothetical protein [Pseudomonas triclosanedens]WAI46999.1 hypothetical protein OU419_14540 [Pseudomonas triclosanedens]